MQFRDRVEAGKMLGEALLRHRGKSTIVYALPRGGVVLGAEVAKALEAPLDLVITRKIGAPLDPEFAVCAVTEEGEPLCDPYAKAKIDQEWLEEEIERERAEVKRRRENYLKGRAPVPARGKTAIVIDDGIATGLTMRAAVKALRAKEPKEIIVAVPIAPLDTVKALEKEADKVIVLDDPRNFLGAVGAHYDDFPQVSDGEVINLLKLNQ